jgi:ribosomal protein S18 acetylase RimI-like enzyme
MDFQIVDARPEHAPFVAWVSLAAARSHLPRGFWDYFLDAGEAECLRYLESLATTSKPHFFHYSAFLVAEVDGVPAAALCGYFDEELGNAALAGLGDEIGGPLGGSQSAAQAGLARVAPFLSVVPEHAPNTWIVENVATAPGYRRRGLVDALLVEILARGRERGARVADIGVLIGNDPAQRAYEKAGFAMIGEKRNPELEKTWGTAGVRSLRRALA